MDFYLKGEEKRRPEVNITHRGLSSFNINFSFSLGKICPFLISELRRTPTGREMEEACCFSLDCDCAGNCRGDPGPILDCNINQLLVAINSAAAGHCLSHGYHHQHSLNFLLPASWNLMCFHYSFLALFSYRNGGHGVPQGPTVTPSQNCIILTAKTPLRLCTEGLSSSSLLLLRTSPSFLVRGMPKYRN